MNLLRLLHVLNESIKETSVMQEKFIEKIKHKHSEIICHEALYQAVTNLMELQEKVEFFLSELTLRDFNAFDDKDFSRFIQAKEEEYLKKVGYYKKSVNEEKLIK